MNVNLNTIQLNIIIELIITRGLTELLRELKEPQ